MGSWSSGAGLSASSSNTFTKLQTIAPGTDTRALILKGHSGANADILALQNAAGTDLALFDATGSLFVQSGGAIGFASTADADATIDCTIRRETGGELGVYDPNATDYADLVAEVIYPGGQSTYGLASESDYLYSAGGTGRGKMRLNQLIQLRNVYGQASGYTANDSQAYSVLTDGGSSGTIGIRLPTAAAGLTYDFVVEDNGLAIAANTSDNISFMGVTGKTTTGLDADWTADGGNSGPDDASASGTYTGGSDSVYTVTIDSEGTPDQITWNKDGGAESVATGITGSAQTLEDGVQITFVGTDNHTAGDSWTINTNTGSIVSTTVGDTLTLTAMDATTWMVTASGGIHGMGSWVASGTVRNANFPMGEIYVSTPSATTLTSQNTYYKCAGTTTATVTDDFDMPANNRLRYIGTKSVMVHAGCSLSFTTNGSNEVIGLRSYIYDDSAASGATQVASECVRKVGAGSDVGATAIHFMAQMDTNDYIEIHAENQTNAGNTLTLENMNLFAMAIHTG